MALYNELKKKAATTYMQVRVTQQTYETLVRIALEHDISLGAAVNLVIRLSQGVGSMKEALKPAPAPEPVPVRVEPAEWVAKKYGRKEAGDMWRAGLLKPPMTTAGVEFLYDDPNTPQPHRHTRIGILIKAWTDCCAAGTADATDTKEFVEELEEHRAALEAKDPSLIEWR
jgi:hypothetical protein